MRKRIFNLRNVAVIFACLAVVATFFSCGKESKDKQITAFSFATPQAVGVINESAKTIAVSVPVGTDVTALVPTITVSEKATVSPSSGVKQDFTNPVTYRVTAEDGSTAEYIVTVTIRASSGDDHFHYSVPDNLKVVYTLTAHGETLTTTIIKVGVECYKSEIWVGDGVWSDYQYYVKPNTPTAGKWTQYSRIVSNLGATEWEKSSARNQWWDWFDDFLGFMGSWASYQDCVITRTATLIGTEAIVGVLTDKYLDTHIPGCTETYWLDPVTKLFFKDHGSTPDGDAVYEVKSWSTTADFGGLDLP